MSIIRLDGSNSVQLLKTLRGQAFPNSYPHVLDLSLVSFVTPVVSVITQILKINDWELILPYAEEPKQYLNWMLSGTYQKPERYITPKIISKATDIPPTTQEYFKIFQNWLSEEAADDLKYSFGELMDNVFDHANTDIGVCVAAQKYPQLDKVEGAIVDLGVGIAYSFENVNESNGLIFFKKALKMKGTSKPDKHSGEGLSSVLEWLKKNHCDAMILSQNHVWEFLKSKETISELNHVAWPGTLIWFAIPPNLEYNLRIIWEEFGLGQDTSEIDDLFL